MAQLFSQHIKTPCIGVCSTGLGDNVCRGCKRFVHEVVQWNGLSEQQRESIDQRLTRFLTQIVESKLQIVDLSRLQRQLEIQQIPYPAHKSPYIWAYELLRAGASQIACVEDFGLAVDAAYVEMPLLHLRRVIDEEFYLLSDAHYERYFLGAVACDI